MPQGRRGFQRPIISGIVEPRNLEGIVDLAFEEHSGWTVVDYKTDRELAALAVHCGQAVSTGCLVDALWADDPPRTAAKTLQNYVLRVRRALARAGGPAIMQECIRLGGCPTGDARATGAGNLPARHVIHAVGPVWRDGDHGEVVGRQLLVQLLPCGEVVPAPAPRREADQQLLLPLSCERVLFS